MPKLKQPSKTKSQTLKDFLDTYDLQTLYAAIQSFEGLGWELMKAYSMTVQRRYEVDALDLIGKGETSQAAYASGYAKALDDLKDFTEGLRQTILGKSQLVENPPPEE